MINTIFPHLKKLFFFLHFIFLSQFLDDFWSFFFTEKWKLESRPTVSPKKIVIPASLSYQLSLFVCTKKKKIIRKSGFSSYSFPWHFVVVLCSFFFYFTFMFMIMLTIAQRAHQPKLVFITHENDDDGDIRQMAHRNYLFFFYVWILENIIR